jgi:tetratricopeptide (TPR) repeat protein
MDIQFPQRPHKKHRYQLSQGLAYHCPEIISLWKKSLKMDDIEKLRQAAQENASDPESQFLFGQACLNEGKHQEAMDAFKKTISLCPDHAPAHFFLAKVFDVFKRYDEMIDAFQEAAWLKPDWAEAHYNLGLSFLVLGQPSEGIAPFKEAIRIQPDMAEAHNGLAVVYQMTGQAEISEEHRKKAIELEPRFQK